MKLTALYKYAFCAVLALVGATVVRASMIDPDDRLYDVEIMPSVEVIPGKLVRREIRCSLKKNSDNRIIGSYTVLQFKTLNDQSCELYVDLEKSSFNHCSGNFSKEFVSKSGKWSAGTLFIEGHPKGKAGIFYSYEPVYNITWLDY
jgi:hypothetical protein